MAERRMFAKTIIDSDAFLDMPATTQLLYFHLCMRADDDGFINNPKKIVRMIGCSEDDLRLLVAKQYVLVFESGVIVIKHWRLHNYIRSDRYKSTIYEKEKALLETNKENTYTISENSLDTSGIPMVCQSGYQMDTQVRLGKDSIELGKDSIGKGKGYGGRETRSVDRAPNRLNKSSKPRFVPPTVDDVRAYCTERGNDVDPESFVDFYASKGWLVGKASMKDWKAAVRTWERNDYGNGGKAQIKTNQGFKTSNPFFEMLEEELAKEQAVSDGSEPF